LLLPQFCCCADMRLAAAAVAALLLMCPALLLLWLSLQVRSMHNILGGVIDAHASYLLLRGMKTLGLRVEHQNRTAMEIAKRLEAHPKVARVHYPGLPSHSDHAIAVQQMTGFGGVISFEVRGASCQQGWREALINSGQWAGGQWA
jgi:cystathionine beta-lyase/cystathionine gamma-synthase